MQFKIRISGSPPDVGAIEQSIWKVDPSALVDIDNTGQKLRIAGSLDAAQLLGLVNQAGYAVAENDLEYVPSECCGGCGG